MNRNLPALIPASTVEHFGGQQRIDLVRDQIAKGTSDGEFALFLAVCERTGLDPFARQIYAIVRGGKMTVQTGIDGYRSIADRQPNYAGSSRPVFEYDPAGRLEAAEVTVHKLVGERLVPFVGVAYWDEHADQKSPMWAKMPRTMLAKCAEAQALRKAFPSQLAGVYTHDEMNQADQDADPWRPYRDSLNARYLALPDDAKAKHRALRPAGFKLGTATPDELEAFALDLAPLEDDSVVVAELVDDETSDVPPTASDSGADAAALASAPRTPPLSARQLQYVADQAAKRGSREAVAEAVGSDA